MRISAAVLLLSCLPTAILSAQIATVTLESSAYGALEWRSLTGGTWTVAKSCGRTAAQTFTDCSFTLGQGTVIELRAKPVWQSSFYRWGGLCGADAPAWVATNGDLCTVTLRGSGTIRASMGPQLDQPISQVLRPGNIVVLRS